MLRRLVGFGRDFFIFMHVEVLKIKGARTYIFARWLCF